MIYAIYVVSEVFRVLHFSIFYFLRIRRRRIDRTIVLDQGVPRLHEPRGTDRDEAVPLPARDRSDGHVLPRPLR